MGTAGHLSSATSFRSAFHWSILESKTREMILWNTWLLTGSIVKRPRRQELAHDSRREWLHLVK